MIQNLELSYPAKPYKIRQGFGIFNPAYEQFGFNRHNGIDFAVDSDGIVVAMCKGVVRETGYNAGAGNYVRYRTKEMVRAEGYVGYVEFMVMHAKTILVKAGDEVMCGTPLIVADNTGFSTGPHTHISAYFLDLKAGLKMEIGSKDSDWCFDFSKYYNDKFADDVKYWVEQISRIGKLIDGLFKR